MRLNLHVVFNDGSEKDIETNLADMVAFEDKYNVSAAQLGRDTKISWLLYLAWHSEKRKGATKDSYDKWLESVDNLGDTEAAPK